MPIAGFQSFRPKDVKYYFCCCNLFEVSFRISHTFSHSSSLRPRLIYLLYARCLRLTAVFISGFINGGSLSLHVIILFRMNLDITPVSVDVNWLTMSLAKRLFD